jgi:uncharacterized LabA/DUF88 family protein
VANFVYVDNSNVWIEGMHVSAVARGIVPDIWTAQEDKIVDPSWRLDFGRLYEFAVSEKPPGRAALFGSRPPQNDSLWDMARRRGFEPIVFDRNVANKEKKVDAAITTEMLNDSFTRMKAGDEITLVAGDRDFVPPLENIKARGFPVYVVFWDHAARELKDSCTRFVSLNDHLDFLRFG